MTVDAPAVAPPGYDLVRPIGPGSDPGGDPGGDPVWEAVQLSTRRLVALKVLNLDVSDPAVLDRFERQRFALGSLTTHPHVLTVYDTGVHGDRPWLTTELCRRGSLGAYVDEHGPLATGPLLAILAASATALAVAHAAGIVHGAIAASNLLVTDYGEVVVDDLGISRPSRHRAPSGAVTAKADVQALGWTMRELAGGPAARLPQPVSDLLHSMGAPVPGDGLHSATAVADRAVALQRTLGLITAAQRSSPLPALPAGGGTARQIDPAEQTQWWRRGARIQAEPEIETPEPARSRARPIMIVAVCVGAAVLAGTGVVAIRGLAAGEVPAATGLAPPATAAPAAPAVRPARSSVRVYNNSDVDGLAAGMAEQLRTAGWTVDTVGNYISRTVAVSTVFYRPGTSEEADAKELAARFGMRAEPRGESMLRATPGLIIIISATIS